METSVKSPFVVMMPAKLCPASGGALQRICQTLNSESAQMYVAKLCPGRNGGAPKMLNPSENGEKLGWNADSEMNTVAGRKNPFNSACAPSPSRRRRSFPR